MKNIKLCLGCGENKPDRKNNPYSFGCFCSKECKEYHALVSGSIFKCKECGKDFYPKSKRKQKYCSQACSTKRLINTSSITTKRFSIFMRDDFTCIYCGLSSIKDKVVLHKDHIIPISKGGSDSVYNLVTACKDCNSTKSGTMLKDNIKELILEIVEKRNKGLNEDDYLLLNNSLFQFRVESNSRRYKSRSGAYFER